MVKKFDFQPNIVLGVVAHPDDLDFGASGSFAKWAESGADIHYLILTDGSKGTSDEQLVGKKISNIRSKEQQKAAAIVGAKSVTFLGHTDGELLANRKLSRDISRVIRKIRPDTVVTMDPTFVYSADFGFINHPDHRAAGQATLDAVYPFARDESSFPELLKEGLEPHCVSTLLLINFESRNFTVDISDFIDTKLRALSAHESQIDESSGILDEIKSRAKIEGVRESYKFAESFVRIDIN